MSRSQAAVPTGSLSLPEALTLAAECQRDGKLADAEAVCREILKSHPNHIDASHLLAIVCHQQGRTAETVDLLGAALRNYPRAADALCNHALMLQHLGRHEEALASYDKALAVRPHDIAALHSRGLICTALGRHAEAAVSYDRVLAIQPADAEAHNNRGVALNALGRHADALASYDKALAIRPDYVQALYNRGRALDELKRYEEALACYDQVVVLDPRHAEAHNNRGVTLDTLGRSEEALAGFAEALAIRPDYAEAHNNRGSALAELDRPGDALASYDAALAVEPGYIDCIWNRALVHLRQGAFDAGWKDYEARRKKDDWDVRRLPGPEWDGKTVPGRRLFLYAEQGLGDTIHFARFARDVAAAGMEVALEVQASLATLMQSLAGVRVVARGTALPPFDCHLPLLSLPHVLSMTAVPASAPYLATDPARIAHWSQVLPADSFRVGIAWQGNPKSPADAGRSIPLRDYLPLARVPGVALISLQKNDGVEQLNHLPPGMAVATLPAESPANDGFIETAAVMMNLDLVITSDTSVAHLAGALGRPVWIALKHVPCWRWLARGETSAWYPTACLFRQSRRGEWGDVFTRMAEALSGRVTSPGPRSRSPSPPCC